MLSTAPTPVITAQPTSAACSSGTASGTGTTARSETTVSSAKPPVDRPGWTGTPSTVAYGAAAASEERSHSHGSPSPQNQHVAAGRRPAQDDPVAHLRALDALADGDDGAGALVAEHDGRLRAQHAAGERQVAVADAGRRQPHPHLPGTGVGQVELGEPQGAADGVQDERAHQGVPPGVGWG